VLQSTVAPDEGVICRNIYIEYNSFSEIWRNDKEGVMNKCVKKFNGEYARKKI
jgi:hypothetical protein